MKQIPDKMPDCEAVSPWLDRLHRIIMEQMHSGDLSNDALALQMEISERHFFRRMKELSGEPPQRYIRRYRLQWAKKYLETGTFRTVKETARAVGFANPSHFIRQFEKEYGQKPLEVLKEWGWR